MDAKDFLAQVVPDDGAYYIGTLQGGNYKQHQVPNLVALDAEVTSLAQKKVDIYFSTGTYIKGTSREAKNVKSKKSLYLDLDCGKGKEFSDKKTAIDELRSFCIAAGLLEPNIVVDSGNGCHAYWSFDEPVNANDWLVYATALKLACEEYKFAADPKVTTDAARILRVPGTTNYKHPDDLKSCVVLYGKPDHPLDDIKGMLSQWIGPVGIPNTGVPVDNSDLGTSEYGELTWKAEYIFNDCPTLAHMRTTGGQECNEPLWMLALSILTFCEDGDAWVHEISNKHAGYDPTSTERKYRQRKEAKDDGKLKPILCNTFAQYASSKCTDCPHKGHINSPISLGKPPPNELPQGYTQDKSGIFKIRDGEKIFCFPYRLENFDVIDYGKGIKEITTDARIGRSITYNLQLPYEIVLEDKVLAKTLSTFGMLLQPPQLREFKTLMVSWAQQMEAAKRVSKGSVGLGWTKRNGQNGFKLARHIIWEDGTTTDSPIGDKAIGDQYEPEGALDKWKEAADLVVGSGLIELQIALASAFASPLVPFTGTSGTMLSVVSAKSGTGKSSALRTAQAVWGSPLHGINSVNDTSNSVAKRLGELHNLPAYWDELHMGDDVDQFIQLIFRLGQGKEKSRLKSDASFQKVGTWATLITVASNESISDRMDATVRGTNAGTMRVLELEMSVAGVGKGKSLADAMKVFGNLNENYGTAGVVYATYITTNYKIVREHVAKLLKAITESEHVDSSDRFRLATITALIVGAQCANKCGLTQFDIPAMMKYLISKVDTERAEAKAIGDSVSNPLHAIKLYIDTHVDYTYVTEYVPARGLHADVGTILSAPKRFPVRIHSAQQVGLIRVDYVLLRDWLTKNYGAGRRQLLAARQLPGIKYIQRATLTSGLPSHVPGNYTQVLEIPYDALESHGGT